MVQNFILKSPWLKSLGLKDPGLKLWVEKSGVEISINRLYVDVHGTFGDRKTKCRNDKDYLITLRPKKANKDTGRLGRKREAKGGKEVELIRFCSH